MNRTSLDKLSTEELLIFAFSFVLHYNEDDVDDVKWRTAIKKELEHRSKQLDEVIHRLFDGD